MDWLESALRLSIPLIFAALGGVLSERVGVVNIALEGMLLAGAFAAMAATAATQQPWIGVGAAVLAGIVFGILHATLVLRLRVDAVISGVGLNLLSTGLTTFLLQQFYQSGGVGVRIPPPQPWLPQLAGIPILGSLCGARSPFIPLAWIAVIGIWWLLHRTRTGLQMRSIGEQPKAAQASGIDLFRARLCWLGAGGGLAALGGAYLCLDAARFTENMSAGKGYLAIAAVIVGRWHPLGAAAAVLLFGMADAVQIAVQGQSVNGVRISSELLGATPYILGLLALTGALGKSSPPAALGNVDT